MSQPPGPPQDPFQPDPDPYSYSDPLYYPDPTAPPPPPPVNPLGGGPVGPSVYPPVSGAPSHPTPTSGAPGHPTPTSGPPGYPTATSGAPGYPAPISGPPGYPTPGYPDLAGQPSPTPGAPGYPPGTPGYGVPAGAAYGAGGAYPPGPDAGYPAGPPPMVAQPAGPYPGLPLPPSRSRSGNPALVVIGILVAMVMLCCVGAVVLAALDDDQESLGRGTDRTSSGESLRGSSDDEGRGAAAPASTAPAAPTPSRAADDTLDMSIGDTLLITDEDGTVEITVTQASTSTKGCRSFAPPPSQGMYLNVDVTIRVTRGSATVNSFDFRWIGDNGRSTSGLDGIIAGCGTQLPTVLKLSAGSSRDGTLTFNVADKQGILEYQRNMKRAGTWRF